MDEIKDKSREFLKNSFFGIVVFLVVLVSSAFYLVNCAPKNVRDHMVCISYRKDGVTCMEYEWSNTPIVKE